MPIIPIQRRRDFAKTLSAGLALSTCSGFLSSSSIAGEKKKYGIAVVGLGSFATSSVIPALKQATECSLTGLVSSDLDKAGHWSKALGLDASQTYNYRSFDRIAGDDRIDLVVVATPNAMHEEFALRAAQAGKHVVIAAPVAGSATEARRMADACSSVSRSLSVIHHGTLPSLVASKIKQMMADSLSSPIGIELSLGGRLSDPRDWRLNRDLAGGGAMMNFGTAIIQAARSLTGTEPISVTAQETKTDFRKFANVDESMTWAMHYAKGLTIHGSTSYTTRNLNQLSITRDGRTNRIVDAFEGLGTKTESTSRASKLAGEMDRLVTELNSNSIHVANAINDLRIIEAVYRSAQQNRTIKVA